MSYRVVSYATDDPIYLKYSETLKDSCLRFNIPIYLKIISSNYNWCENTHKKASFIKECFSEIKDDFIVWTDADSELKEYPNLFNEVDCDFAAHWFKDEELISATMYWNNTPKAHELLNKWIELNTLNPKLWDQVNLQTALNQIENIIVVRLPPEYNFISDLSREYYGNLNPVFEHYQASRKYKARLNTS